MGSTYISAFSSSPPPRDRDPVAKIEPTQRGKGSDGERVGEYVMSGRLWWTEYSVC